ncbi:hypothetical protein K474DRAFT_1685741 [Panus rudis PR-1116 ss-1]|nr:hypothetical protein K474DRAFT_1685741 [Panus rudis PR-1116 ss-1]
MPASARSSVAPEVEETTPLVTHSSTREIQSIRNEVPPLLGDSQGRYRVQISTLGAELATLLGPNWEKTPTAEFQDKVRKAFDQSDKGWVVDGNYTRRLGSLVSDEATDIIWLDPPLLLYLPRVIRRSILRLLRIIPTCAQGCKESFVETFFSRDSIIWWCISQHWQARKTLGEAYRIYGGVGDVNGGKMRRFGGWGGELERWKREVRAMVTG